MNKYQPRKKKFAGKNVVILGATGGLGSAYTDMFLMEGANVYLGIRSMDKLSKKYSAYGDRVRVGLVDISNADQMDEFAKAVQKDWKTIDYVINATGYDVRKELLEHSAKDIEDSIHITLMGAIFVTRYFLPLLNDNKDSTIVHMGGFVDGGLAFPYYSVDVATRSGLYSFCESMNRELKQEGHSYHLTYFCPNPANTQAELPFHPIWKEMKTKISTVEEVAQSLSKTLRKRKSVSFMGGPLQSGFAKLNHISVKLSNLLLMNHYSKILKAHFGIQDEVLNKSDKETPGRASYTCLAAALIIFSFVIYLGVPFLPCLATSGQCRTILFIFINIVSWSTFLVGSVLGGKEVLRKVLHK